MRRIAWVMVVWLALAACAGPDPATAQAAARCAHCGMRVDPSSSWRSGATATDGATLAFDAPKCMIRFVRSDRGRGAREPWVTEYYSGERRAADTLFYVLGSDVRGPMGEDLVPIEGRERAERFRADHHGERVLAWSEIDQATIDALFRP